MKTITVLLGIVLLLAGQARASGSKLVEVYVFPWYVATDNANLKDRWEANITLRESLGGHAAETLSGVLGEQLTQKRRIDPRMRIVIKDGDRFVRELTVDLVNGWIQDGAVVYRANEKVGKLLRALDVSLAVLTPEELSNLNR